MHHREAQTAICAETLCGKERLKDVWHHIGGNTFARIAYCQHDIAARFQASIRDMVCRFVDQRVFGFNRDASAIGHRIPRIDHEV